MPALLTKKSIRPKASLVCLTISAASFVCATSHCVPRARTFMASISAFSVSAARSEEHTSELQSPCNLVCRLLLEKKNNISYDRSRRFDDLVSNQGVHLSHIHHPLDSSQLFLRHSQDLLCPLALRLLLSDIVIHTL